MERGSGRAPGEAESLALAVVPTIQCSVPGVECGAPGAGPAHTRAEEGTLNASPLGRLRAGRPGAAFRTSGARARLALLFALALLPAARATPARGSTEEFSSFDVERPEEDDESTIDHLLARPPAGWREEWERAPQAFRTSQGCFTSGQWYTNHQLKLASPLGRRARFGLRLDEVQSDLLSYENLELWFLFPQRLGTLGVMFRPYYDKSRQDFALTWELGADTTRNQLRLVYGFEDLFNNLWVWRQTRVGESSSPYDRHPWEPAFKAALRRPRWHLETEGRWLTLARRRVDPTGGPGPGHEQTLWGTWGSAELGARALGTTWTLCTENRQASSTDQPLDLSTGDARRWRRLWRVELAARRAAGPGLEVESRWLYLDRAQNVAPPLADAPFHAIDRTLQLEARWTARADLAVRLGGLFDRVSVAGPVEPGHPAQGTRIESRAYFGLAARFGRVSVCGVEGIELDPEPYEVWHHHDKGFLSLQTTF